MRKLHELVNRVAPGTVRSEELGFSLENGAGQLAPWFDQVGVARYPDRLVVTEAEPLLAYVRSYATGFGGDEERALREEIQAELAAHGAFSITKDTGMVTGVKR